MQRDDFLAVIVAYFPDPDLPGRIDVIPRQFERVVIVDIGFCRGILAMIEDLCGVRGQAGDDPERSQYRPLHTTSIKAVSMPLRSDTVDRYVRSGHRRF
jgi:hypothetical protein